MGRTSNLLYHQSAQSAFRRTIRAHEVDKNSRIDNFGYSIVCFVVSLTNLMKYSFQLISILISKLKSNYVGLFVR